MQYSSVDEMVFRSAPDAIFVADGEGRILHVNASAAKMTGFSIDELMSMSVDDLVPAALRRDHPGHRAAFNNQPWDRPMAQLTGLSLQMKDGTIRPVTIELGHGRVADRTFVIASVRDDQPMQDLRREIEHQAAIYRDLFDHAPVAYLRVSPDGHVEKGNHAAAELMGMEAGGLVGVSVLDLYAAGADGRDKLRSLRKAASLDGSPINGEELRLQTRDGRTRWVRLYTRPFLDEAGNPTSRRAALVDITTEKELMAEKNAVIAELRAALDRVLGLEGMLGVCAWCKKVRDETGAWLELETYVRRTDGAEVTHGICPPCAQEAAEGAV